jgi:hypothetical protein
MILLKLEFFNLFLIEKSNEQILEFYNFFLVDIIKENVKKNNLFYSMNFKRLPTGLV